MTNEMRSIRSVSNLLGFVLPAPHGYRLHCRGSRPDWHCSYDVCFDPLGVTKGHQIAVVPVSGSAPASSYGTPDTLRANKTSVSKAPREIARDIRSLLLAAKAPVIAPNSVALMMSRTSVMRTLCVVRPAK
jgi:hypothetical protein